MSITKKKPPTYVIYTDGSCVPNPGPGACAFVLFLGDDKTPLKEAARAYLTTTNNRMELMAALWAMQEIKTPSTLRVFSDSQYLVKGMNEWVYGWISRNWYKWTGDPVQNTDIWKQLVKERERHIKVTFTWVRGHIGNTWNERCDQLAVKAIRETADEDMLIDELYKSASPRLIVAEEVEVAYCLCCGLPAEDGREYCGAHLVRF